MYFYTFFPTRIQAMETLLSLGQQKVLDTLTAEQHGNLSSTFANFLPGIVLALTKVATADEKQGSKVTAVSICQNLVSRRPSNWCLYTVQYILRDVPVIQYTRGVVDSG